MIRILGKTEWDKIDVGEVFAWRGQYSDTLNIEYRQSNKKCIYLSNTLEYYSHTLVPGCILHNPDSIFLNFYKLPESVQKLFKEE